MLETATVANAAALQQERTTRVEAAVPAQPPPSAEAPSGGGYPAGTTAKSAPAQPTTTSGGDPPVEVTVEQEEADRSTQGTQERTLARGTISRAKWLSPRVRSRRTPFDRRYQKHHPR